MPGPQPSQRGSGSPGRSRPPTPGIAGPKPCSRSVVGGARQPRNSGCAAAAAADLGAIPLAKEIEALATRSRIALESRDRSSDRAAGSGLSDMALTRREVEVLALLAEGRTNRQIADTLFISESTASVHVSNILGKLGVSGRTEAAAVALRGGLVAVSPGVEPPEGNVAVRSPERSPEPIARATARGVSPPSDRSDQGRAMTRDPGIVGRGPVVAAGTRPVADPRLVPVGDLGPDIGDRTGHGSG